MEHQDSYKFEVRPHYSNKKLWDYLIFDNNLNPIIESTDWFETQNQAHFAAIGHISLLKGEKK